METFDYPSFHAPLWTVLVFLYLVVIGWRARKPKAVSILRLFLIPIFFSIWSLCILYLHYVASVPYLSTWIFFMVIGTYVGWISLTLHNVEADKRKMLIKRPGGWTPLILILTIFAIRSYFGYLRIYTPSLFHHVFYIYADLILTSFIIGLFLGRALHFLQAYRKAPHTPLNRGC